MAIRRVTGAVSPSELVFADANALGATYDGTGTTIERGETFTLPSAGTTAVSNGALRLEALKGDCTITNNGNSTLTNASGVDGTIVMRSGASDFPAFVRNSSLGSMSIPAREDFTGDISGTVSGTINSNATFPAGHIIQVKHFIFTGTQDFTTSFAPIQFDTTTSSEGYGCGITLSSSSNKVLIFGRVSFGYVDASQNSRISAEYSTDRGRSYSNLDVMESDFWAFIEHAQGDTGQGYNIYERSFTELKATGSATNHFRISVKKSSADARVNQSLLSSNTTDNTTIQLMEVVG